MRGERRDQGEGKAVGAKTKGDAADRGGASGVKRGKRGMVGRHQPARQLAGSVIGGLNGIGAARGGHART